ncbi:MAG: AMP-binding protein [Acidobacteria bacterium]|nr:AMP-binding protein [Acidobacteriota bacterium]
MAQRTRTEPTTFNERFETMALRVPDRIAFRLKTPGGYTSVTYREAHAGARATAAGLLTLGLEPASRVAVLSENRPEWVTAYLGAYLSGMVAVPLDTQISPEEWRRLIEDSDSRVIFVSGLLREKLEQALAGEGPQRQLISFDPVPGRGEPREELAGFLEWASALPDPPPLPRCAPSDVVTIIYTSGTTGTPKGVCLTHGNILSEIESALGVIPLRDDEAFLCLLPLQHVLASVINVLVPLYLGGQVVFADTLRRTEILAALEEAGITILVTVPQFFYLFHNRIQEELGKKPAAARRAFGALLRLNRFTMGTLGLNLGPRLFSRIHRGFGPKLRLFISGGSAFDPVVAQDFHDLGFTILQGYGLTETTGACAVTPVERNVIGSVGPALPGTDIRISDPDETGVGEILVRGPVVMREYYRNPEATREAVRDGWFHTGDLGRLDARGNLFVTGRRKEVIVLPNGKNIYPDELETYYGRCSAIREIAVIGVVAPQERGERLHAVVVPDFDYLKSKKIANTREILRDEISALSNRLPKYKRLMSYQLQSEPLPRTTTRKIKRIELKRLVESGQLREGEIAAEPVAPSAEDRALMESAIGQEVARCLAETYHREETLSPSMNLELDLGFDSMEKVELLASLEQALNLRLPEDFGAEIFTLADLIRLLEQEAVAGTGAGAASRQSWETILAAGSTEDSLPVSGPVVSLVKYLLARLLYFVLFLPLLRLETRGLGNLPARGPYLVCPNHQSYLDAFVLVSALPYGLFRRMFFVGYSFMFTSRLMKLAARLTNIVPVDPDAHLLRAMKAGAAGLRRGLVLCIFPEGGRSYDGKLQDFKKGAAILARELGVPLVPAAIEGTHAVWPRDSLRIRPHKVRITFGAPIPPAPPSGDDPYAEDTDRLRREVALLLAQ